MEINTIFIMDEKLTYLCPVCEVLQTEVLSNFLLQASNGFDQWEEDDEPIEF